MQEGDRHNKLLVCLIMINLRYKVFKLSYVFPELKGSFKQDMFVTLTIY